MLMRMGHVYSGSFLRKESQYWKLPMLDYLYFGSSDNRISNLLLISIIQELWEPESVFDV